MPSKKKLGFDAKIIKGEVEWTSDKCLIWFENWDENDEVVESVTELKKIITEIQQSKKLNDKEKQKLRKLKDLVMKKENDENGLDIIKIGR